MGLDIAVDSVYMLFCTALLPTVLVGIALFYSGLTQRRSSLTMLALPFILTPLVFVDWYIWGYSLCYALAANKYIGSLNYAVLRHLKDKDNWVFTNSRGEILVMNHFIFNGFFKVICAALTFPGCIAERGRILPMLVFLFFWSTIIYNPVTYWFWSNNGWLSVESRLPVLDFAGGTCIHIVSGATTFAYSYILGPRNPKLLFNYRNSNTGYVVIGTAMVMFGWVGFIAGCDFKFSTSSLTIVFNTLLSSFVSAIIWTLIDYFYSSIPLEGLDGLNEISNNTYERSDNQLAPRISETGVLLNQHYHESKANFVERRKLSMISFSSGAMVGLVVMTPAGGYVSSPTGLWKGVVFGVIGAVLCNLSTRLKYFFHIDDALDVFAIHGIAGIIGSILTGIFGDEVYASKGGWVAGHWVQIGYQILGSVVSFAYCFILSLFFLYLIDIVPGLHLRIDKDFNRRIRQMNSQENNDTESPGAGHKLGFYEKAELLGSDSYEFNSEFNLDFMEFIRVIRPQDFQDNDMFEEEYWEYHAPQPIEEVVASSDYEMYANEQRIRKTN